MFCRVFYPLLLVFYLQFGFAQDAVLFIEIDNIVTEKLATSEVKYTIAYHITNNTPSKKRFFFNTNGFGMSLSNRKVFSLFENGKRFDGSDFLKSQSIEDFEQNKIKMDSYIKDSLPFYDKSYLKNTSSINDILSKNLMQSIMSLEANETKKFVQTMYWQKNRYYIKDDIEFYLTEKSTFELQFTLILLKEAHKPVLSNGDFESIKTDKNFLQGVFYSNKKEIIFTD